ncbi:MAG TPA: metallophosphoesterase [Terriglobales bacterium]|nr:metallophosphoesterase [Terriglobales bacterium]
MLVVAGIGMLQQSQARKKKRAGRTSEQQPLLSLAPKSYPFTFVAYGDTRFMDPADHEHSDPERRRAIVQQIAADKPDFVVINGDIVHDGGIADEWKVFDQESAPLRAAGVRIFPALGNHDVRGGAPALASYFQRFPEIKERRWYSVRYGNCLFVILDSDVDHGPGSPQGDWLKAQLEAVPKDVDFVFLAMHHPPYTKSSEHFMGGGHTARPEEQDLAGMLEARQKTLQAKIIAIAGHVHNYERYEHGGVEYIVSGGGGATPYMIQRGPDDFYHQPGPTYHYCTFTVDRGKLGFEMHKLDIVNGEPKWSVGDKFELKAAKK